MELTLPLSIVLNNRKYPNRPLIGVGAVVIKEGKFLLVKRKYEPNVGNWSLPGGLIELGEKVCEALIREVIEECGIEVKPTKIIEVIDFIEKDKKEKLKYHYVIIDYEAEYINGILNPASDVTEVNWFALDELINLNLPEITYNLFKKYYL